MELRSLHYFIAVAETLNFSRAACMQAMLAPRQPCFTFIVDLHAEHPGMSWREIAEICYIRYNRKPSHHSIKRIATTGPPPSLKTRRYQPWHLIPDPAERKHETGLFPTILLVGKPLWNCLPTRRMVGFSP